MLSVVMCCLPPLAALLAAVWAARGLLVTLEAPLVVIPLGHQVAGLEACKGCCRPRPACLLGLMQLLALQLAQREMLLKLSSSSRMQM